MVERDSTPEQPIGKAKINGKATTSGKPMNSARVARDRESTRRQPDRVFAEIRYQDDSGPQTYFVTQNEVSVGRGGDDLWVSEFVLTYDGVPSYVVSIMEFRDGLVAHETQYFGDRFDPSLTRAHLVERVG